jgi:hypothetical protein
LRRAFSGEANIANGQSVRLEFGIIMDCLTKCGISVASAQQRRDFFDGRANEALAAGMVSGRS